MDQVNVRVGMKVWDDEVEMEMTLPAAPARLESLLPVFQKVADGLVEPRRRTCRRGGKGRLVQERVRRVLPPDRADLRGRGAAHRPARGRASRAAAHGGPHPLRSGPASASPRRAFSRSSRTARASSKDEIASFGLAYFHLGIPCPFLEEESCSIHADRPISCREYLVTSPAANCADPKPGTIDQVELPGKVWTALARAGSAGPPARFIPWVPLVLAPDWASAHPDASEPRPVEDVFRGVFAELAGRKGV